MNTRTRGRSSCQAARVDESEPHAWAPVIVLGSVSVLAAVAAVGMLLAPRSQLTGVCVAVTVLVGLGVPPVLAVRGRVDATLAYFAPVLAQTAVILLAMVMVWTRTWLPRGMAAALVTVTLFASLVMLRDALRHARAVGEPGPPHHLRYVPALLAWGGFAAGVTAAWAHRGIARLEGMALTAGPVWFLGAALIIAAFCLAWWRRDGLGSPVIAMTSLVVVSQAAMYGTPTVMVAARHIGVLEDIVARGALEPSTNIYQAWAGLFALGALVVQAAGAHPEGVLAFASAWGAAAQPVMVLGVRVLAGYFVPTPHAWAAALLFGLGSSLTTSFYAPQVAAFIATPAILALLIGKRSRHAGATAPEPVRVSSLVLAGVIAGSVAVTHQLTPYMLFVALAVAVVVGRVRPVWVPLVPLATAVPFALVNWPVIAPYLDPADVGDPLANLAPPSHANAPLGLALINRLSFLVPAAALVVIGVLALAGLYRHRNRTAWMLALAAGSPLVLMAGTSYGNEGVFRVALFALPWLSILACLPSVRDRGGAGTGNVQRVRVPLGVTALFAVQVLGLTGMDASRVMRADDVAAVSYFETHAPAGSVLAMLGTGTATPAEVTSRHAQVGYVGRDGWLPNDGEAYSEATGDAYDPVADLEGLTRHIVALPGARHFAYMSDAQAIHDERYGHQSVQDHARLQAAVDRSPVWIPVFHLPGVTVYEHRGDTEPSAVTG